MEIFEIYLTEISNDEKSINEEDKEVVGTNIYNDYQSNSEDGLD